LRVDCELSNDQSTEFPQKKCSGFLNVCFGFLFFIISAFIPLRESLFPPLYPDYNRLSGCAEIKTLIKESVFLEKEEQIIDFCESDETVLLKGYGFYPRIFDKGEGYYDRPHDLRFGIQDFSRLIFRSIGKPNTSVFIKTDREKLTFPNGALVYTLYQDMKEDGADYVLVAGDTIELIISKNILSLHTSDKAYSDESIGKKMLSIE
jgi:hypothetical protein